MTYRGLAAIAAASISLTGAPALAAPFNTALSATEADEVMNGDCSLFKSYAITAAPHLGGTATFVVNKAVEVLRENMPLEQVQKLMRDADAQAARGKAWEKDVAEFQICLLNNKIAYAEAHERAAKK
jgi:hypothetical protein